MLWKDAANGFDLMAVRAGLHGAWCGYVGVPRGHWAHGMGYDEVDEQFDRADRSSGAHCGLTFSEHCMQPMKGQDAIKLVCHPTEHGDQEDDVWWLGFDCSHCDDIRPMDEAWLRQTFGGLRGMHMEYRTLPYVRSCVEELSRNLTSAP